MRTRIISGIALVIIVGGLLVVGGYPLLAALLAVSIIGMYELYRCYNIEHTPLAWVGYMFALIYYAALGIGKSNMVELIISGGLIAIMVVYVISFPKYNVEQAVISFFGIVYVAVMLAYIYRIRIMEEGFYFVWLAFICSWVADTCAYFVGVMFGKHKMTPVLSPKKSVEGAIGGIAGAMIIGGIYGCLIRAHITVNAPLVFAVACGAGAALSIFGDLTASAIKRSKGVKDYGKIIPGHGGILDRFDSTIFTAPVVYTVITIFTYIF